MNTSLRSTLLARCRDEFGAALVAAVTEAGIRSPELFDALRNEAHRVFDELAGLRNQEEFKRLRSITASRISLVHPDDMDLTVAMINLSHDLTDACERELPRLHLLFMTLLGQDTSVVDQLPVGPDAVCVALRAMCDAGELVGDARVDFPSRAKHALAFTLRSFYSQITQMLQAESIEPFSLVRSTSHDSARSVYSSPTAQREESTGNGHGYGNAGQVALSDGQTLDGPLNRLQNTLLRRRGGQGNGGTGGGGNVTMDPSLLAAIIERVFMWLSERQQTAATQAYGSPIAPTNFAELNTLLPAANNATLDAISLSLDVLQADPELCTAVKPSLERLRLPLCKLALIDAKVLTDPEHAAHGLLDSLLRLAYSLAPDTSGDHPVVHAIEDAAHHIQQNFERDLGVFVASRQMLDACFDARLGNCRKRGESVAAAAERETLREHSRNRAARAIRALCAGDPPAPIRDFLEQLWVRVLAAIHQHAGEKSEAWLRALATANQLVDSVQARSDPAARQQLVASLPGLLQQLRAGLDAIGTPAALREKAFQGFVECHTAVILGRTARILPSETLDVSTSARIDDFSDEVPGLSIVRLPPDGEPEREVPEWVLGLGSGHWFTLHLPEQPAYRMRVERQEGSPRMFVAVAPDANLILVFPQRWLVQYAQTRQARPCELEGAFNRAAETAIARYH
jgi:hypothetical protein